MPQLQIIIFIYEMKQLYEAPETYIILSLIKNQTHKALLVKVI